MARPETDPGEAGELHAMQPMLPEILDSCGCKWLCIRSQVVENCIALSRVEKRPV